MAGTIGQCDSSQTPTTGVIAFVARFCFHPGFLAKQILCVNNLIK